MIPSRNHTIETKGFTAPAICIAPAAAHLEINREEFSCFTVDTEI